MLQFFDIHWVGTLDGNTVSERGWACKDISKL